MIKNPNFYSVIIGSEILNQRREDAHFEFVNKKLHQNNHKHKASFIIEDDPEFMIDIFTFIKKDKNSVLFSFGGIGATPDDYTREITAKVFRDGKLYLNEEAKQIAIDNSNTTNNLNNRVKMAYLPKDVKLLNNIVNKVPAYQMDDRFFFMPGFPSMAHNMVETSLDKYYPKAIEKTRKTIIAFCGEGTLIEEMQKIPKEIEFSSLPSILKNDKKEVEISFCAINEKIVNDTYRNFCNYLSKQQIKFKEI